MTGSDVAALLADHCFTTGLSAQHLDRIAGHASVQHFPADTVLFTEGGPAERLYLVVTGRVALQLHVPGRGEHVVDTVDECDTVGWSWMLPPYLWFFDARAVTDVVAVVVDAAALRREADADPAFGYALLQRVTAVMLHRLQAARVRLVDLYGVPS
jgi:CRP-like cAMP-binding protein